MTAIMLHLSSGAPQVRRRVVASVQTRRVFLAVAILRPDTPRVMSKSRESSEVSREGRLVARFGQFAIDERRRQIACRDAVIHLTPKAFDLLLVLVSEAPRVLTKHELHQRLWPDSFVTDASLAELVKELRRALDDRDRSARIIRTAHRIGYALSVDVRRSAPAAVRTLHWLVVRGRRVPLGEGENVIGRDPGAGVWLDEAGISRRHARITIAGGQALLEDLGSKNGTTVRLARVAGPVRLRDSDRISFGGTPAVFRSSATGMSTETHASGTAWRGDRGNEGG
jgi:DNA-binding winged helix-turn-helix (wHTH) protein